MLIAGRYELSEELGRGGMGAVYRAHDRSLGRSVAFKRLERDAGDASQRERRRRLFEREYRTLVALAHPHIVTAYDYGTDADGPYYVMELLEGADMRELAPLPYPQACRYLREVAASLALLHARRLVHRDVTPRNVRLLADGTCKLLDFGLLAAFGDRGEIAGTPPSIAPEALDGEPLDQRADLYALGALAYFMLTGRHAYPVGDPLQLPAYFSQPLAPPSALVPAKGRDGSALPLPPRELDELVLRLLRIERMARPSSAGAVIDRLDVILADSVGPSVDKSELSVAESYLASAPLIGRTREIAHVKRLLEQLGRGHGGAALFDAPSGIGKSRLLRELALEARLEGALVLRTDAELHGRPYASALALCRQLREVAPLESLEAARPFAAQLMSLLPELAAPNELATSAPSDAAPARAQLQSALRSWLLAVAAKRSLFLVVDNLQACDEPSAVLLASLAHEAKQQPIAVVGALRSGEDVVAGAAIDSLRQLARTLTLSALTATHTRTWFESVFGDATHLGRFSQFLHARTSGNPATCMQLLRFMLGDRAIRYSDGTWILPSEPNELELPEQLATALLGQERLSERARELGAAFALYRGLLTPDVCRTLADASDGRALALGCHELVVHELLETCDGGYRWKREELREALLAPLSPERRAELHARVARVILSRESPQVSERLEAGLHLLSAGDEHGAQMLCADGLRLALCQEPLGGCLHTLEAALELFREQGRSPYEIALVLAPLGLAAYMVDRRMARYAAAIAEHFEALSGLALVRRLRPFLGKTLATFAAVTLAALRYRLLPKRMRHTNFRFFVQAMSGALLGLCGKAAVCLDGAAIERIRVLLEPLTAFGKRSSANFAYDYCVGLGLMTEDRYARTQAHFLDLEHRLARPNAMRDITAEGRLVWEGGVNHVLGVLEAFSGDANALARATRLERSGLDVHALVAAQLRLQYHGFRGETEQVRAAFAELEARAIQTGYAWQVETWSAIAVNLFGGLWNDVIITKRSLEETERLRREEPSLDRYAESSKALYLLQRGDPKQCAERYELLLGRERPLARIGWSASNGLLAEAYNQLGEHKRALAICEDVMRHADPEDARYFGLRLPLEIPRCHALGALGDYARAEQRLSELFALYASSGSPLALGSLHEGAARLALAQGDRKSFTYHLKQVERLFCPLGNPTLIARFRNLTELGGSEGGIAKSIAEMREVRAFEAALSALDDPEVAARHILAWVLERYDGYVGYVFGRSNRGVRVLAASAAVEPRRELFQTVEKSLDMLGKKEDTTLCGTEVLTMPDGEGGAHVYLLSYVDDGVFHGEGALVLVGRAESPPRIRYELLQSAAEQLQRLRAQ